MDQRFILYRFGDIFEVIAITGSDILFCDGKTLASRQYEFPPDKLDARTLLSNPSVLGGQHNITQVSDSCEP